MAQPKRILGSSLKKFPGATWNALVEGELRDRVRQPAPDPPGSTSQPQSAFVQLVWTDTTALPPGSVVVLTEPLATFEDEPSAIFGGIRFKCEAPTTATLDKFYAITCTPIEAPATGRKSMGFGHIPNAAWAQVTINDEADETAELLDAETLLSSTTGGRVPIVWKPTGTGVKWCVVSLGGANASAELIGALAIIKGTVPASADIDVEGVLDAETPVVTPGVLEVEATADTFTAGALLVNPDGTPIFRTVDEQEVLYAIDVLNPSYTDFIGESIGVFVAGSIVRYDAGEGEKEYFILPRFELRTEPGWVIGTNAADDAQGLYHEGAARDQKVGRGECAV